MDHGCGSQRKYSRFFMRINYLKYTNTGHLGNLPMVEAVMDARRPSTHENGREIAIALVAIFPTCMQEKEENNQEK